MNKISYISRRFDEAAILATLAKITFTTNPTLLEQDYMVIAAFKRSSPDWDLPLDEMADRLSTYDESQISGLVNNVKGILHEMEFQRIENEDGDSVIASLFPDTNHQSVDIQLLDENTGDTWAIQLKATDNVSTINDWMEANPDTEIFVTEELAEKMNIPSSGISNDEITMRVEDFVDRMIKIGEENDQTVWDYFPPLVAASAGIIVFELWRRYKKSEITFDEFKNLAAKTLGLKAAKYGAIFAALAIPGLNVMVSAYLLGSLIFSTQRLINKAPSFKPFSFMN